MDLNCLDNIKDFVHQQKDGNKWVRSGEVIDAGAKIYGFRVDNVHQETYRMLSGMVRNAGGEQEIEIVVNGEDSEKEQEAGPAEDRESDEKKKKVRKIKFAENQGEKTLDKPSNINLDAFDTLHEIDPLFRQTT